MSEGAPQPWEVWHARFDFSEGRGYKYRPVIVLAARESGSLVAMVTGVANKLSLPHDYRFAQRWVAATPQPTERAPNPHTARNRGAASSCVRKH